MAPEDIPNRYISSSFLSSRPPAIFKHSDYFDRARPFPSPAEVRANPILRDIIGSCTTKFESLNLVVKYGEKVTASEGLCLQAMQQLLPDQVPVPEVYGWCEDGGECFIYMELIKGVTLESQWESLSDGAKKKVCKQLRTILDSLRKLEQDPDDRFLGRIDKKPLLDIVFTHKTKPPAGPFATVKEFHDWLSALIKVGKEIHFADPSQIPDPWRESLPDDARVVFTHADLHPSNIMVSPDGSGKVLAIIDWHQSGWYPDYWEYCKALFTSDFDSDWAKEYIPQFVDVAEFYDSWAWYPRVLGY
ncbi:kinase-like protein [Bimuria novae-zelandiae CBS 107.79]|uniref:Kinase-like protein n=1 Tax=Bimuria novae-zelandiae CBS 107.79 TaxID=1447943 RepID=A0A6A5UTP4_9PLEO|nr:kinase-like protein [Bimuria novae-zelandiae CBS 107.79]